MRLDIESLRVFYHAINDGGVNSAARRLYLSQSAVSHKLKRLEQKVGKKLFNRDGHEYLLTQSGRQLMSYAERLVSLHDEAVGSVNGSTMEGHIRLGAAENVALAGMTDLISDFRFQHPLLTLQVTIDQSLILQEKLRKDELDMALLRVTPDQVKEDDTLLWYDKLVWVGAKDAYYADLQHLPLVSFGSDCFYLPMMRKALASRQKTGYIQLECNSHEVIFRGVKDGLGIAAVNRRTMPAELRELPAGEFGELGSIAYVIRRRRQVYNAAMDGLEDCIKELDGYQAN